jgi:ubiquitin-protein ligase E3 C
MFWDILEELSSEDLLLFFKFCTGCTRIPIDGFNSLPGTRNKIKKFCIESPTLGEIVNNNRLIEAKTCFNRVHLPEYSSKDYMKKAINTIINNDTNYFGLM